MRLLFLIPVFLLTIASCEADGFHVYVGSIETEAVTLAWGKTQGSGNTIGRDSASYGRTTVVVGPRELEVSEKNWLRVDGLEPDREYPYRVSVGGRLIGSGSVRTQPERADRLCFLVIGDYGTGRDAQHRLAAVMAEKVEERRETNCPVRFVLTTGDNVYGKRAFAYQLATGNKDRRWEKTFFEPYAPVLRHVPFYISLGNHDGNDSERRGDLREQLDNFFFPSGEPVRWYSFSYGGLAEFFALDTTDNTLSGPSRPMYLAGGEQFAWFQEALEESTARWKIAYFHHPPYSAGPKHRGRLEEQRHIHEACVKHGVQAVFNGHEHNLQFTDPQETGGIQYVISGSGGELRSGEPARAELEAEHIAGIASQRQFLVVEIEGDDMRIQPVGYEPLDIRDPAGRTVEMPLVVRQ